MFCANYCRLTDLYENDTILQIILIIPRLTDHIGERNSISMHKRKVIIIGAGPAGLTAAYELERSSGNFEVTILEASDRIGGISQTITYGGNRMDIGGHRFFSKDRQVVQWWENILPTQGAPAYDDKVLSRETPLVTGGPDPEAEDRVMLIRDRVSRIYFDTKFFDYPISLNAGTIKALGFSKTLRAGFSYLGSLVRKLPETSLENFYINRFGRVLYSMFFEGYTEKLWGIHPRDISADWGAQRVKGLSIGAILKNLFSRIFHIERRKVETSLIEQFSYPKYGPGQLWELAADEAVKLGAEIRMLSEVTALRRENGRICGVDYIKDGKKHRIDSDIVISTMPLRDLVLSLEPPQNIREIALGLPYRDFVTVGILVKELNLTNLTDRKTLNGLIPDCWIYVQDSGIKMGRIQIFNNWSPYMVKNPENTVWIGTEYFCQEGDDFWCMDNSERVEFVLDELEKMNIISRENVLDSHCERIKKAYPAYFGTYDRIDEVTRYLDSIGNLYCIGRNGQHRYNNMDHSMVTAFRAVENIISGSNDKKNIWSVNTDAEYHESHQE